MTEEFVNIVLAHTNSDCVMLDCDYHREDEVIEYAKRNAKRYKLGSALVMMTSEVKQMTFDGHILNSYCTVFGKTGLDFYRDVIPHVERAYREKMVSKQFLEMRGKCGSTTIRVNRKNDEKPHPKYVYYFPNGDNRGVMRFLRLWAICKNLGEIKS